MKTSALMIALALVLSLAGAANAKHCPDGRRHGGSCLHRATHVIHHPHGYT